MHILRHERDGARQPRIRAATALSKKTITQANPEYARRASEVSIMWSEKEFKVKILSESLSDNRRWSCISRLGARRDAAKPDWI